MGLRLSGQAAEAGDHAEDSGPMKWAARILIFVGGAAVATVAFLYLRL